GFLHSSDVGTYQIRNLKFERPLAVFMCRNSYGWGTRKDRFVNHGTAHHQRKRQAPTSRIDELVECVHAVNCAMQQGIGVIRQLVSSLVYVVTNPVFFSYLGGRAMPQRG